MYKPSPLLAPLLFVPGLIFETVIRLRNLCYSAGLRSLLSLPRPVISVGNITLGGTGKTPLVIYVARTLRNLGHAPAVLSRGYGRRFLAVSRVLPPGEEIPSAAYNLGDEPALIRRCVPEIWLGISPNRYAIGRDVMGRRSEVVFVLDDAFQHRRLRRDLDIVVIDRTQPLLRNHIFPLGSLRESLSGLRRAHAVVLNGSQETADANSIENAILEISPRIRIFHCIQKIGLLVPFAMWNSRESGEVASLETTAALLVAALGNPARFLNDVEDLGIRVAGSCFFRDHHCLSRQDWHKCIEGARRAGTEAIIITEKDAIKIVEPPDFPLLVAIQSTFIDQPAEFEQMLREAAGDAR